MLENIKYAMASIWGNKVRSLLTLLGVVIGVSSVTTLVALGEGLKRDVSNVVDGLGTNILTVIAGDIDTQQANSTTSANPANFVKGDILKLEDVGVIAKVEGVEQVNPLSLVAGKLKVGDREMGQTIIGTYPNILNALELIKVGEGRMFTAEDSRDSILLSHIAAKQLFPEGSAVGKQVAIGKHQLTVTGVTKEIETGNSLSQEYQQIVFIPFDKAIEMNGNKVEMQRIFIKAKVGADVPKVKQEIRDALLIAHGQKDFSVLSQDDLLGLMDTILDLATSLVSAIAAISLVVGGIGIMNIMLVTVTERTKEIGLRKAVGATQAAILQQFLTEAVVITVLGGLVGLLISFVVCQLIALNSDLTPRFTPEILGLTFIVSLVVGAIFGIWPAMRAARKDPIEALRYE